MEKHIVNTVAGFFVLSLLFAAGSAVWFWFSELGSRGLWAFSVIGAAWLIGRLLPN